MKVELIRAWPRRFERLELDLAEGACVADALDAAGWCPGPEPRDCAIFGVAATAATRLRPGDRIELLRPLLADPKDARRRRAKNRAA